MRCSVIISALVSGALAFKDTAPMWIGFDTGLSNRYIEQFDKVSQLTQALSADICAAGRKMAIFEIEGLTKESLEDGTMGSVANYMRSSKASAYVPHVQYHHQKAELLQIDGSCSVSHVDMKKEWVNVPDTQVVTVRLSNNGEFESAVEMFVGYEIIVQGLPTFGKHVAQPKHKREIVSEEDYEKIEEELDEAFKEVEKLLEGSEDDTVSLYNSSSSFNTTNGSLFDKYTYFTPGIWMGTIVSLFLLFVFSVALDWISSLQVSYKAFDKPFNAQKKVQ